MPDFLRQELKGFLKGYWRNLMQSQTDHFEILAEKLTVQTVLQKVAEAHTIPLTIMRGMNAMVRKKNILDRYRFSQKRRLILLVVTDLDPMGDTSIAEDLVKSFKRDFGLYDVIAYKAALTIDQVQTYQLVPSMDAKTESPGYAAYVEKYNTTDAWELEAMDPGDLAQSLTDAIDSVIDIDAYNQEVSAEEANSAQIIAIQKQAKRFFESLNLTKEDKTNE